MPINDKLNRIKEIKGNIKDAIVEKGVEVTDSDSFNSYADKIREITAGGGGNTPDKPTHPEAPKFVKPDDWIDIREGIPDNAIRFLVTDKYFSDADEYDIGGMLIDGSTFTINWGDGTSLEFNGKHGELSHKFDKTKRHVYVDEYGFEHGQYMIEIINGSDEMSYAYFTNTKNECLLWCVNNLSGIQDLDMRLNSSLICYEFLDSPKLSYINFNGCVSLTYLDVSNWDVSSVTNMYELFRNCYSLTYLDVSNWDVSSVTDMSGIFIECESLTYLDVSNWDVSGVTNMNNMFRNCYSLTYLDVSNWDVSGVTNMNSMFYCCYSLTYLDVSNWDVSGVTNMCAMFNRCYSLTYLDVSNWDVSSVTDMSGTFNYCRSITNLDVSNWDVSSVTNTYSVLSMVAGNIFTYCESLTNLDVSRWITSNMSNMRAMFKGCKRLKSLDVSNWDVSSVTNMEEMFYECESLKSLDVANWGLDEARDINMKNLFSYCKKIETVSSEKIDLSRLTGSDYSSKVASMFNSCQNLKVLDLTFQDSVDITYDLYLAVNLTNYLYMSSLVDFSITIPRPTFAFKIRMSSSSSKNYNLQRLIIKGQETMDFTTASPQIELDNTYAFKEDAINEFFTNLPNVDPTKNRTISLKGNPHAGYANMGIALEKGWNVLYDSSTNSTSTIPLGDEENAPILPLVYCFIPGEDGTFVDANGNKCNLLYSQSVATMNPIGWEMLPTFEDALNKYGIEVEEEYREEVAKDVLAYANDDSLMIRYNIKD